MGVISFPIGAEGGVLLEESDLGRGRGTWRTVELEGGSKDHHVGHERRYWSGGCVDYASGDYVSVYNVRIDPIGINSQQHAQ